MAQPKALPPQDRLAWLDYAKAIGIILVVFGHASRSIGRTNGLVWSDTLQSLDTVIYAFHMPLFFLIAGFAAGLPRAQDTSSFLKSLFWGVAVPYFVWSALWVCLKVLIPDATNVPVGISALGNILWQPVEHFWFLYHLFFIRAGWYLAKRLSGPGAAVPIALTLAAAGASAILITSRPDLDWVSSFLKNFAIYGIGLVWLPMLLKQWGESPPLRLMTLGGALCLWGIAVGGAAGNIWPAIGGALVVVGIAKALPHPSSWGWNAFAFLGEASLAIYVMHLIAGTAVRVTLAKAGHLNEASLLVSATLAGLVIPAVTFWIALSAAQRIGPALPRLIGLGTATRSSYMSLWHAAQIKQPLSSS
jgi:fucose 4-O-acetylase-like acetyltransferase